MASGGVRAVSSEILILAMGDESNDYSLIKSNPLRLCADNCTLMPRIVIIGLVMYFCY